jgi:hypothetical protein
MMNCALRAAYLAELTAAEGAVASGDKADAFRRLEHAHILSQRYTFEHVRVHWRMLRLAASIGARREVVGQLSRVVAAAVFSRVWVPVGNTGRANVSAFKSMPVPDDLRSALENDGV